MIQITNSTGNAWLVIAPDDTVTIRVAQSEMGEGVFTSMPMMVAEELQCDWNKVKAEYASANRSLRENQLYKRMSTNGSGAVRRSREYLQQAGASARQRLIQAAANQWGVPASACTSKDSVITHTSSGRTLRYGEVAAAAAQVQLAQEPAIKKPSEYTLMGQPVARLDTPLKIDGSAIFGADVRLPNMLFATSKTSPIVGASIKSFDFNAIKNRPGVHSVVEFGLENQAKGLRSGVAVVADTWYRAKTALDLLPIEWDYGPHTNVDSVKIAEQDQQVLNEKSGAIALDEGNALETIRSASTVVEAVYGAPHQAHATMEPLGCTAQVESNRVDVWLGTQGPEGALREASEQAGVAPENVYVHNCFLGGGFGGRGSRSEVSQAVAIAKTLGPVVLILSMFTGFALVYLVYFSGRFRTTRLGMWLKSAMPFRKAVQDMDDLFFSVRSNKRLLVGVAGISLLSQSVAILLIIGLARSIGITEVPWVQFFVFEPILFVVMAVPISLGGWGVGEYAYAHLFGLVGVPANQAIALSVLYKLAMMVASLPGGVLFALGMARRRDVA